MDISLIIPVFNEEKNIKLLYDEINEVLPRLHKKFEIIFIDDGSSDKSLEVLKEISLADANVKLVPFRKNYGQTAAIQAGFDTSEGDAVIALDADLQNDPGDIPKLLQKFDEGYDVVSGWRRNRKDNPLRVIPSRVANGLINWLVFSTGCRLHDYGCTLKAYRKWVAKNLHLYGEMHRFIPAFAALEGAKVAEIEVNHRERKFGQSKYGFERIFKVLLDLVTVRFFTTSLTRPLHFFGKISKWTVYLWIFSVIAIALIHYFFRGIGINFNTYLLITVAAGFIATQFIILGLLGEIIIRAYFEGSKKKQYTIK